MLNSPWPRSQREQFSVPSLSVKKRNRIHHFICSVQETWILLSLKPGLAPGFVSFLLSHCTSPYQPSAWLLRGFWRRGVGWRWCPRREHYSPEVAIIALLLPISLKRVVGTKANRINDFTQPESDTENVTLQCFQLLRILGGTTEACAQGSSDPEKPPVQFLLLFKWPMNLPDWQLVRVQKNNGGENS